MSKSQTVKDAKLKKQEVLQAVVLADDFTTNLSPMQDVYPSVLTPVTNAPLLDYLFETLIQSGVHEVFIFCSSHIEQLKNYIASKNTSNITVSLIISDGCRSLADALRDIDAKGWIRDDFILIRGDAFMNANLSKLMDHHKRIKQKDKGAAMTIVLRDLGSSKNSMLETETCLFAADGLTKKVLFYKPSADMEKKVKFELEWFLTHEKVEINSGFVDTHVYMCSPSVLPLLADNFDFQTMDDFIRGLLINEEILDARIYWQPLRSEDYGLPMTSWLTYHTLNRDILQRRGYPLTPDMFSPLSAIVYTSRSVYKHRSASLARGSSLQKDTIVGKQSVLGRETLVSRSVIGDNCIIGDQVNIENSYILGNVKINNKCTIKNSVIFPHCILSGSIELDGCILSRNVKLPDNTQYNDSVIEMNDEHKIICKKMSEYREEYDNFMYFTRNTSIDLDVSESDDTSIDGSSSAAGVQRDDCDIFLSEVIDSILRGYQDKINCENLILEINASRFAWDVGMREVTYNVIKAILMLPLHYLSEINETLDNTNYRNTLKVMIEYFKPILMNYTKIENAHEEILKAFEDVASTTPELLSYSSQLLNTFYRLEILCEPEILEWYNNELIENNDEIYTQQIQTAVKPFIDWLQNADEESSEEDEE